ncbi:MAG: hypothetical protein NZ851_04790 [Aquificaceae bacterium]|nr:hypothetical protein [Aquificaceae bacterium]
MFWLLLLMTFSGVFALDCHLLRIRYMALKENMVYEDLMREAEILTSLACEKGNIKAMRSADRVLQALEGIRSPDSFGKDKVVASKRLRRSSLLLNETQKHSKRHPQLFAYQLLFHHVARENYRVGDYNYALKYSMASYNLGKAILELR